DIYIVTILITPRWGLCIIRVLFRRTLSYAIDCTAFSRLPCRLINNVLLRPPAKAGEDTQSLSRQSGRTQSN
ncbi:MAG: hypothetical protein LBS01_08225, partial [Prevotellaceae bacterium]|nr:hypothetical protein [Prevotellaceae bacterium]